MTKYGLIIQVIGLLLMGYGIGRMLKSGEDFLLYTIIGLVIIMIGLFVIVFDKKNKK